MPPHIPSFRWLWYASLSVVFEENMVVGERFELVRMVGRGGMGSVWEARDLRLSTLCAVKLIEVARETAKVAEAHSRFQPEAQAAAQLRSPHVAKPVASPATAAGKETPINLGF